MTKFITADTINWKGKIYKAQTVDTAYNLCTGCAFRWHGLCHKPYSLREYACLPTTRTDRRDIIWVKGD